MSSGSYTYSPSTNPNPFKQGTITTGTIFQSRGGVYNQFKIQEEEMMLKHADREDYRNFKEGKFKEYKYYNIIHPVIIGIVVVFLVYGVISFVAWSIVTRYLFLFLRISILVGIILGCIAWFIEYRKVKELRQLALEAV